MIGYCVESVVRRGRVELRSTKESGVEVWSVGGVVEVV